jgi:hypothetical protein
MDSRNEFDLLLPVVREGDRYVWDRSQPSGLDELPRYGSLRTYLARHYKPVTSYVEWKGLTLESVVFEPHDVTDLRYALIDPSAFESSESPETGPAAPLFDRVKAWIIENLDYSEPGPWGALTRIDNEFVKPTLAVWDHTKGSTGDVIDWEEIAGRGRVVLMGAPGIGKTTCLRKVAIDEVNRAPDDPLRRLPIYIQLREVTGQFDMLSAIQSAVMCQANSDVSDDLQSLIQSGRILLLLDGLDEVHESLRGQFVAEILQVSRKFQKMGIYLSTRQWDYYWRFPGFLHLQIQAFNVPQIEEWMFRRIPKTDWKVTKHLVSACNSDKELANLSSIPIMLALVAGVFELTGKIPRRRSDIIARFLDTILESWDTIRRVRRSDDEALKEDKIELLYQFAFYSWEQSRLTFDEDELTKVGESWSDLLSIKARRSVLRDTGIFTLHTSPSKTWSFTHQVFRDYLAAQCLVARPDNFLETVLREPGEDKDLSLWRHACSITSDASPLLRVLMENKSLPDYQRERWLAYALADGSNVPKVQQTQIVKIILDKLNAASTYLTVTNFSKEADWWQLDLTATGSTEKSLLKSITDLLQTVVKTGWAPRYPHLFAREAEEDSDLISIVKTLAENDWIVDSKVDESNNKALLKGRIPG